MSALSIASFQKILSTSTANGIVSLEDGQLSVSSDDREYCNASSTDWRRKRRSCCSKFSKFVKSSAEDYFVREFGNLLP